MSAINIYVFKIKIYYQRRGEGLELGEGRLSVGIRMSQSCAVGGLGTEELSRHGREPRGRKKTH